MKMKEGQPAVTGERVATAPPDNIKTGIKNQYGKYRLTINRRGVATIYAYGDEICRVADADVAMLMVAHLNQHNDLVEAAMIGRNACQILAQECGDEGNAQYAKIWERKAQKCHNAIEGKNYDR